MFGEEAHGKDPHHVTVYCRDAVFVPSAEELHRFVGARTGAARVEAMQSSPNREFEFEIEPGRAAMPARDIA